MRARLPADEGEMRPLQAPSPRQGEAASYLGISFNKDVICCGELVMVVDKKVVYSFKMCDHIKVMCVSGRQHCGWQGQHAEETMDSVTL